MSSKPSSFWLKIIPEKFNLGIKINLVVFSMALLSLLITSLVALHYQKKSSKKTHFEQLELLSKAKQEQLTEEITSFRSQLKEEFNKQEFSSVLNDFKTSFTSYKNECSDAFYGDSLTLLKNHLKEYYEVDALESFKVKVPELADILPEDDLTSVLQTRYIFENPQSVAEKYKFLKSSDGSTYSATHNNYHNQIRKLAKDLNASDIYFADHISGDVFYSLNKDLVFATNLYSGKFNHLPIGRVFKEAAASNDQNFLGVADFSFFQGAYNKPVMFVSIPIVVYSETVAVVILQFDHNLIDNFIYDTWIMNESGSIDYNLIGKDLFLRGNPKSYLYNPENFVLKLSRKRKTKPASGAIKSLESAVMTLNYENSFFDDAIITPDKGYIIKDYSGKPIMVYTAPIDFLTLNWHLIVRSNYGEVLSSLKKVRFIVIAIIIAILLLVVFVTKQLRESIVRRIIQLRDSMIRLAHGEVSKIIENEKDDELGETIDTYNNLRVRIDQAIDFANDLADGNYQIKFDLISEEDALGKSLNTLKEKLQENLNEHQQREKMDEIQNWLNSGIAKFNDYLRQSNDNLNNLSYIIIEELVAYLSANQGGIYMVEGNTDQDRKIVLSAGYAYDRRKFFDKSIEIGEGLIGSCYLEKKPIHLNDVPEDYLEITSGLGAASPKHLYIVPLIVDDNVLGLIEVASFNPFEEYHIEFIGKVANNIAATFKSVRLNTQTSELLEESKKRANEIAQQEEEMRQNLEEMQATQEELARLRDEDEKRTKELQHKINNTRKTLQALIDNMPGEIILKDDHGVVIHANALAAKRFKIDLESMPGKSDSDLFNTDEIQKESKSDMAAIKEGEVTYEESGEVEGKQQRFSVTKKMVYLEEQERNGVLAIRKPI